MTRKFFSLAFLSMFALIMFGIFGVSSYSEAQTADFPAGCSSGLGYSVTTGEPCSGTDEVIPEFMPGCNNSALGFSVINGEPCSGGEVAINWLEGCTSIYGFSTIDGAPCNGTLVAQLAPGTGGVVFPPSSPGLPTTGMGGNALLNIALLFSSGIFTILGLRSIVRRSAYYEEK